VAVLFVVKPSSSRRLGHYWARQIGLGGGSLLAKVAVLRQFPLARPRGFEPLTFGSVDRMATPSSPRAVGTVVTAWSPFSSVPRSRGPASASGEGRRSDHPARCLATCPEAVRRRTVRGDRVVETCQLGEGRGSVLACRVRVRGTGRIHDLAAGAKRVAHPSADFNEGDPGGKEARRKGVPKVVESHVDVAAVTGGLPDVAIEVALSPEPTARGREDPSGDVRRLLAQQGEQLAGEERPAASRLAVGEVNGLS
jgi:hypothetical protein